MVSHYTIFQSNIKEWDKPNKYIKTEEKRKRLSNISMNKL